MAIISPSDKAIKDLLENDYPIKAIPIDFSDLNNKTLVIKSSFTGAYEKLDSFDGTWCYVVTLNMVQNCIDVIGIVNLLVGLDGWLKLNWIETNKAFKKKGYVKNIIDYLKKFAIFRHYKGIRAEVTTENKQEIISIFKKNDFVDKGNGKMEWSTVAL